MKAVILIIIGILLLGFNMVMANENDLPEILIPFGTVNKHSIAKSDNWMALHPLDKELQLSSAQFDMVNAGSETTNDSLCVKLQPVYPKDAILYIHDNLVSDQRKVTTLLSGSDISLMPGQKLILPVDGYYMGAKVGLLSTFKTNEDLKNISELSINIYFKDNVNVVNFEDNAIEQFRMPKLLWAGDMDGDGKIDLLLKFFTDTDSLHSLYLSERQKIYECYSRECDN